MKINGVTYRAGDDVPDELMPQKRQDAIKTLKAIKAEKEKIKSEENLTMEVEDGIVSVDN